VNFILVSLSQTEIVLHQARGCCCRCRLQDSLWTTLLVSTTEPRVLLYYFTWANGVTLAALRKEPQALAPMDRHLPRMHIVNHKDGTPWMPLYFCWQFLYYPSLHAPQATISDAYTPDAPLWYSGRVGNTLKDSKGFGRYTVTVVALSPMYLEEEYRGDMASARQLLPRLQPHLLVLLQVQHSGPIKMLGM
jgi:hypothetical protein